MVPKLGGITHQNFKYTITGANDPLIANVEGLATYKLGTDNIKYGSQYYYMILGSRIELNAINDFKPMNEVQRAKIIKQFYKLGYKVENSTYTTLLNTSDNTRNIVQKLNRITNNKGIATLDDKFAIVLGNEAPVINYDLSNQERQKLNCYYMLCQLVLPDYYQFIVIRYLINDKNIIPNITQNDVNKKMAIMRKYEELNVTDTGIASIDDQSTKDEMRRKTSSQFLDQVTGLIRQMDRLQEKMNYICDMLVRINNDIQAIPNWDQSILNNVRYQYGPPYNVVISRNSIIEESWGVFKATLRRIGFDQDGTGLNMPAGVPLIVTLQPSYQSVRYIDFYPNGNIQERIHRKYETVQNARPDGTFIERLLDNYVDKNTLVVRLLDYNMQLGIVMVNQYDTIYKSIVYDGHSDNRANSTQTANNNEISNTKAIKMKAEEKVDKTMGVKKSQEEIKLKNLAKKENKKRLKRLRDELDKNVGTDQQTIDIVENGPAIPNNCITPYDMAYSKIDNKIFRLGTQITNVSSNTIGLDKFSVILHYMHRINDYYYVMECCHSSHGPYVTIYQLL